MSGPPPLSHKIDCDLYTKGVGPETGVAPSAIAYDEGWTTPDELDAAGFGGVINLAGAPIGDARWTESRKKLLRDSRVHTTARLVECLFQHAGIHFVRMYVQ